MSKILGRQIADNTITATQVESGTITSTEIASRTMTADRIGLNQLTMSEINSAAAIEMIAMESITAGNIIMGNSADVMFQTAMAGDVTITNSGVTDISPGVIGATEVNSIPEAKIIYDTVGGHRHDGTDSRFTIGGDKIWAETPTGILNGINNSFSLASTVTSQDMAVFVNGIKIQRVNSASQDNEFTHVTGVDTFFLGIAPGSSESLEVSYNPV